MAAPLRVLCVHGVGHQDVDATWQPLWTRAIEDSVHVWNSRRVVAPSFVTYDDLFAKAPLDAAGVVEALWKLLTSGIVHGIGDLVRRRRGLEEVPQRVRWTAGMIVQWVQNERLRAAARTRILDAIEQYDPEVVCAHSLGSLVAYDAFIQGPGTRAIEGRTFVTLGSQIGNAFVRGTFGGRLVPVRAQRWRHLFNRYDSVFTAPLRIADKAFTQVRTPFDIKGIADHDAVQYLAHPDAVNSVWRDVAGGPEPRGLERGLRAFARATTPPKRRALLIGINEYPQVENRLEGCVNDVFLMSSVLQDTGFVAEEIRVVLDKRATARGIRSRLHWLLDGVKPGDQRVLYYSGHGAQIPAYGAKNEVDHLDECLVPWDFDWTPEHAITDDAFFELYSQLPYDASFAAIFDCCHSGGMNRQGGARVRGVDPPDDVRHRLLRWSTEMQMWEPRNLARGREAAGYARTRPSYSGKEGATHRLGRAIPLRRLERRAYVETRKTLKHKGPYLPVIVQACQEQQLSYEYRHGVTSYGAFTFSLAEILRRAMLSGRSMSLDTLCTRVAARLRDLEYDQEPLLLGPKEVTRGRLPWGVKD